MRNNQQARGYKRRKKAEFQGKDFLKIVLSALVIAFLITRFLLASTMVEGTSMQDTLQHGDRLFVLKVGLNAKRLKRGDIVVFHAPDEKKDYIKRVIAFPHEYVQIENGLVYINGKRLEEPYIKSDFTHTGEESEWLVGEGEYFVLGDNRLEGASKDSRVFGCISQGSLVGKAIFRYFPFDDVGGL